MKIHPKCLRKRVIRSHIAVVVYMHTEVVIVPLRSRIKATNEWDVMNRYMVRFIMFQDNSMGYELPEVVQGV